MPDLDDTTQEALTLDCIDVDPGGRYAIAVERVLRDALRDLWEDEDQATHNIRVMPDDRPSPGCGTPFFAIRPEVNWQSDPGYLMAEVDVIVAITVRMLGAPLDRRSGLREISSRYGSGTPRTALYHASLACIHALTENPLVPEVSNGSSEHENFPRLLGPLRAQRSVTVRTVDAAHFSGSTEGAGDNDVGLLGIVRFTDGLWYSDTTPTPTWLADP
jgi:hypothetical protein